MFSFIVFFLIQSWTCLADARSFCLKHLWSTSTYVEDIKIVPCLKWSFTTSIASHMVLTLCTCVLASSPYLAIYTTPFMVFSHMRNSVTHHVLRHMLGHTIDQQLHHWYQLVMLGVQLRWLISWHESVWECYEVCVYVPRWSTSWLKCIKLTLDVILLLAYQTALKQSS